MAGVPRTPIFSPNSYSRFTGVGEQILFMSSTAPALARVRASLRLGEHQTTSAFFQLSVPGPVRGKNIYRTRIPKRLISAIWLCSFRQYAQSTSVNTVMVYFGFGGEKINISDSGTELINAMRACVRSASVKLSRDFMS